MPDDIDKLGAFDKIKLFFATLGSLGIGGFLAFGPTEMFDTDFAYFRHMGWGMLAVGACFFLILVTEGSRSATGKEINFRIKSLMVMLVMAVLGGLTFLGVGRETLDCWKLSRGGKFTMGEVVSRGSRVGYKNKRIGTIRIKYDGNYKWVDGNGTPGGEYPVRYMPDDPERMHKGYANDGFLAMLDHGTGKWATLGLLALGALFGLWFLFKAKDFFFGRPDPPAAA